MHFRRGEPEPCVKLSEKGGGTSCWEGGAAAPALARALGGRLSGGRARNGQTCASHRTGDQDHISPSSDPCSFLSRFVALIAASHSVFRRRHSQTASGLIDRSDRSPPLHPRAPFFGPLVAPIPRSVPGPSARTPARLIKILHTLNTSLGIHSRLQANPTTNPGTGAVKLAGMEPGEDHFPTWESATRFVTG